MNRKTLVIFTGVALFIAASWGVLALTGAMAAKPQAILTPQSPSGSTGNWLAKREGKGVN
jgi:hypothetical protein